MNQKKCPKCGESNPAEAVMCWACYTPLGSSAAAVATAGAGGAAVAGAPGIAVQHDEQEKKAIPPWQIAVLAIALLLAVGFGVKSMMGSGGGTDAPTTPEMPLADPGMIPPNPGPGSTGPSMPSNSGPTGGGGGSSTTPLAAPFTLVSPPNPRQDWGIIGIVVPPSNTARASQIAAFAMRQMRGGRNRAFHVYVFTDAQAGQVFSKYQAKRRGSPLSEADYLQLTSIWPKCIVRYEYNGGREKTLRPSSAPTGWWYSRG